MSLSPEEKIAQIFAERYSIKDADTIARCIKSVIHGDHASEEPLIETLTKNSWSDQDARQLVTYLKDQ